jgi:hypothetical protein
LIKQWEHALHLWPDSWRDYHTLFWCIGGGHICQKSERGAGKWVEDVNPGILGKFCSDEGAHTIHSKTCKEWCMDLVYTNILVYAQCALHKYWCAWLDTPKKKKDGFLECTLYALQISWSGHLCTPRNSKVLEWKLVHSKMECMK